MSVTTAEKIRSFWQSDRAILMCCIGIAFAFWWLNKLSKTFQSQEVFVVSYQLPKGKTFVNTPPSSIVASTRGTGWNLLYSTVIPQTRKLNFQISNNAIQRISDKQIKRMMSESFGWNLEIAEINVENIEMNIEDESYKEVPLITNLDISCKKGYQLKEAIQLSPNKVLLTGPKSVLDTIQHWQTEPLTLQNLENSQLQKISLAGSPLHVKLNLTHSQANIKVEQITEKDLFVPVIVRNAPSNVRIFPNQVKLHCITGLSKYNLVNASQFEVEVNLANVVPNSSNSHVLLNLVRQPVFVRNVQFTPQVVECYFEK